MQDSHHFILYSNDIHVRLIFIISLSTIFTVVRQVTGIRQAELYVEERAGREGEREKGKERGKGKEGGRESEQ